MRYLLALSLVALTLPVAAAAQGGPGHFRGGFGFGPGFHGQPVTGEPYSAVEKITSTEPLTDGTKLTHVRQEQSWRDAQGRIRTEVGEVGANGQVAFHHAEIFDPSARTMTILDLDKKTAMVMHLPERRFEGHRQDVADDQPGPRAFHGEQVKMEDLPAKTVAGVSATGKRMTRTHTDASNGRALVSTFDRYEVPDLKITLYSAVNSPRETSVSEVTSLNRNEPDATLFQVPSDFTVKDAPGHRMHGSRPRQQ
ncbi:MAG TPA: hypothetical protein VGC07_02175 [Granulicella sp.]